ncbi:MAG TPA: SGNH/GDSL hydrolase family protein [Azospirillum sp.]|nr:SGNH/GDSL hydrolase family protein [Azospirillum sp.]
MQLSPPAGAMVVPVSGVVVFGDSLSDAGNATPGRFSNGAVWVERLAERLGHPLRPASKGGTNFAVGGARTVGGGIPGLRQQADAYLKRARRADPDALYVVYGGGNDLRAVVEAADPHLAVLRAADTVAGIVADLAKAGAREFLVPNLPDLGRIPEVWRRGPQAVQIATLLSAGFNEALARSLDGVEARTRVRIHRLDVWALLAEVLANPQAAGFSNVTDACVTATVCAEPDRFLFWDTVHPTAAAHAKLAEAALAALSGRPRG